MTMNEICFICGTRMGKGNQPAIGAQERMNKLVSVSQTVEHSSTIISDILSRILKEAVMHEESICRICFNKLNDIDYHLNEAQEATDELTNKFLDKGKNPLSYKPLPIVTAVTVSSSDNNEEKSKNSSYRKRGLQPVSNNKEVVNDAFLTEDEMSVNIINKNKAKLLNHVLNPKSKARHDSKGNDPDYEQDEDVIEEEEEEEEVKDSDEDEEYDPVVKKRRDGSKKKSKKQDKRRSPDRFSSGSKKKKNKHAFKEMDHQDSPAIKTPNKAMFFATKSEPPSAIQSDPTSPIACTKCKKVFKKKSNLQLHMEKMHELNQAPVLDLFNAIPETHKCNLCPREFTNEKSLATHKIEHQAGVASFSPITPKPPKPPGNKENKEVVCPQCNKTFRRAFNMRIHIDRVHNKKRPFPCKFCSKAFATNSDLTQHMTVHGEGKSFKCEECGRSFTNRDSIILHRKQHTNQRTHFCSLCDKGFFKASCLNRHMRTHTGERPYKCDICGKGFSQSTTVKLHREKCSKQENANS